jgi:small nuclear ribonucleoprotein (snRNP)-like protein
MKTKALIVNFVLFVVMANATSTFAQSLSDWEAVKALSVGEKLNVRLKDGKKREGTVRSVSDTQLVLTRRTSIDDLDRAAISKIHRIVPRSTARSIGKSTAMGAGIGFGTGAGVGIWGGSYEDLETAGLVGLLGGFGAAVGAGIGALVGAIYVKPRKVLIYEFR